MDERSACAALKQRFEQAGLRIVENVPFDEDGVRFEIDGFDAARRIGYEFISEEAGDSWDVGDDVIAELAKRRAAGDVFIFLIAESEAPDKATLLAKADTFLASLPDAKPPITKPPATRPAAKVKLVENGGTSKRAAKASKPAAKATKPAAKASKPAAKASKPATKAKTPAGKKKR
jgi:hypothetical protein